MDNDNIEKAFGKILQNLRKKAGVSQEKLALNCGLDRTYISLLERGMRQPTLITLFKICKELKIKPHSVIKELENLESENT